MKYGNTTAANNKSIPVSWISHVCSAAVLLLNDKRRLSKISAQAKSNHHYIIILYNCLHAATKQLSCGLWIILNNWASAVLPPRNRQVANLQILERWTLKEVLEFLWAHTWHWHSFVPLEVGKQKKNYFDTPVPRMSWDPPRQFYVWEEVIYSWFQAIFWTPGPWHWWSGGKSQRSPQLFWHVLAAWSQVAMNKLRPHHKGITWEAESDWG